MRLIWYLNLKRRHLCRRQATLLKFLYQPMPSV
jgi:hypothetical protein